MKHIWGFLKKILEHVCWIKAAWAALRSCCADTQTVASYIRSVVVFASTAYISGWFMLPHCGGLDGQMAAVGERGKSLAGGGGSVHLSLSLPTHETQPTLQSLQHVCCTGLSLYSHWVHIKGLRSCVFMFILKTAENDDWTCGDPDVWKTPHCLFSMQLWSIWPWRPA